MNKIVNINLGGYPFSIDEDAYGRLSRYLNTIHHHFETSEGYDEITTDIEIRMAELFQERMGSRAIVTTADVEAAISIMGTPEDFGAAPMEEEPTRKKKTTNKFGIQTGKRLFRNEEDAVLGGVCSGLAAYLGIKDPLWLRLILILLVLSSAGFLVPAYFVLWAVIPEAKTAADRLAMRGERINASNIGKMVEEEMKDLSSRISDIGEDLSEKFGGSKKNFDGTGSAIRDALSGAIYFLGKAIHTIIDVIKKVGRPFLVLISVLLGLGLLFTWVAGAVGISLGLPFADYLVPERTGLAYLGVVNVFSVITIPLAFVVLLSIRLWSGVRLNKYWSSGMVGFFVVNLICLVSLGSGLARDFQAGAKTTLSERSFSGLDTLRIEAHQSDDLDQNWMIAEKIFVDEDQLFVNIDRFLVKESEDDQFHIKTINYSRGKSLKEAEKLARTPDCSISRSGNTIILPTVYTIPKGTKFRGQDVKVEIYVPKNAHLEFDRQTGHKMSYSSFSDYGQLRESEYTRNDVWQMSEEGLTNTRLKAEQEAEQLTEAKDI
ncbi:MAG: PspC domain-containing protein [Bacteroidota bacterium]